MIESCATLASQNCDYIFINKRESCLSIPINYILKIIEYSIQNITSKDHLELIIKLLIETKYSENIFELSNKIIQLYNRAYDYYPLDIRSIDCMRPFKSTQLEKIDENNLMEFGLVDENCPFYLTCLRQNPISHLISNPEMSLLQKNKNYQSSSVTESLPIISTNARSGKLFSFNISKISEPGNIISPVFKYASRK